MAFPPIPKEAFVAVGEANPLDASLVRDAVGQIANPPDGPFSRIMSYGKLLLAANRLVNLTGAKNWEALLQFHLLDCVTAGAFIPGDVRVIADWGSGGGMPGLVWAALRPEIRFLLCERTQKKSAFLEEAVLHLGLTNTEVLKGQAEEVLRGEERVDLVVARAVEPLGKLLQRLDRENVGKGGLMWMAGAKAEDDWAAASDTGSSNWVVAAKHPYSLGQAGKRSIWVLRRRSSQA